VLNASERAIPIPVSSFIRPTLAAKPHWRKVH
jgi:hypothetical protein